MFKQIIAVMKQDLKIVCYKPSQMWVIVSFFLLCALFLPFAVGSDITLLRRVGAGFFVVAILLSSMLSLNTMFKTDYEDGTLMQMVAYDASLISLTLGRIFSFWLTLLIPLILATPFAMVLLNLSFDKFLMVTFLLFLITLPTSFIGSIGASIILSANNSSILLPVIIVPLLLPVLIFGANGLYMCYNGYELQMVLLVLASIATFSMAICPPFTAYILKKSVEI